MSSYFNKIFNIDKYENALRECNKDILNFTKDYNSTKKEITQLEISLEDLSKQKELKKLEFEKASSIKEKFEKYSKALELIQVIKKIKEESKSISFKVDLLNAILKKLKETLIKLKVLIKLKEYLALIKTLKKHKEEIIKVSKSINTFKVLENSIRNILSLNQCLKNYKIKIEVNVISNSIKKYNRNFTIIKNQLNLILRIKALINFKQNQYIDTKNIKVINRSISKFKNSKKSILEIYSIKSLIQNHKRKFKFIEFKEMLNSYNFDELHKNLHQNKRICPTCNSLSKI